jgi:hypothetical protein
VAAGVNGRPSRVRTGAAPRSSAAARPAYALNYTFVHPHTEEVTHFAYTTTLAAGSLYADDPSERVLAVACSVTPAQVSAAAPVASAVFVEVTVQGRWLAAATLPLQRGGSLLGSAAWGCSVAPGVLPARTFNLAAVSAPLLLDDDADSHTFGAWMVNSSSQALLNATEYVFFHGPQQQYRAALENGTFPDVLGDAAVQAGQRKLHGVFTTSESLASTNYPLPALAAALNGVTAGPFSVSGASASINPGGTLVRFSLLSGASVVLNAALSVSATVDMTSTVGSVATTSAGEPSQLCIPPVCLSVSFFGGVVSLTIGLFMDVGTVYSYTSTMDTAFTMHPSLTLTGRFDSSSNDFSMTPDFSMDTDNLPVVSGFVSGSFGLRPRLYAGAFGSGGDLECDGLLCSFGAEANIAAGMSYTFYLDASLAFRVPSFVDGTLPALLSGADGCNQTHAARLSLDWHAGEMTPFAEGSISISYPGGGDIHEVGSFSYGGSVIHSYDIPSSHLWGQCLAATATEAAPAWSAMFTGDSDWLLAGCSAATAYVCGTYSNAALLGSLLEQSSSFCSGKPVYAQTAADGQEPAYYIWRMPDGGWAAGSLPSLCNPASDGNVLMSTTDDAYHPAAANWSAVDAGEVIASALSSFVLAGCPAQMSDASTAAATMCGTYTALSGSSCRGAPVYTLSDSSAKLFLDPSGSNDWVLSNSAVCDTSSPIIAFLAAPAMARAADPVATSLLPGATWRFWNASSPAWARVPPPPPSPPVPPLPPPPPPNPPSPPATIQCNPHNCNPYTCNPRTTTCGSNCDAQAQYVCGNSGDSCYRNAYCDSGSCSSGWFSTGTCDNFYCYGSATCYNTCYDTCLAPTPPSPPSLSPPPSPPPRPPSPTPPVPPPPPPSPPSPPRAPDTVQCNPHDCNPFSCNPSTTTCAGICGAQTQYVCGNSGASCYRNAYCNSGSCSSDWFSTGTCSDFYCSGSATCYNTCYDTCLAPSPPPAASGRRRLLAAAAATNYSSMSLSVACEPNLALSNCPPALADACGLYSIALSGATCSGKAAYSGPGSYGISYAGASAAWLLGTSGADGCVASAAALARLTVTPTTSILTTSSKWVVGAGSNSVSTMVAAGTTLRGCALNNTPAVYRTPTQATAPPPPPPPPQGGGGFIAGIAAAAAAGGLKRVTIIIIAAAGGGGLLVCVVLVVIVRRRRAAAIGQAAEKRASRDDDVEQQRVAPPPPPPPPPPPDRRQSRPTSAASASRSRSRDSRTATPAARDSARASRPRIPRMHVNEEDEPPLNWQMRQFVKEHVCSQCEEDDLTVRRQQDGELRVRCRACGTYVSTRAVLRWFAEEGPSSSN